MGCRRAALILLSALACGCSALPSYGLKVNAPNKDVLHLVIYLKERAEPAVYQQIALQEVSRIHAERRQGPPLYEVSFEFQKRSPMAKRIGTKEMGTGIGKEMDTEERLARVVIRFQSDGTPGPAEIVRAPAQRIETTLY